MALRKLIAAAVAALALSGPAIAAPDMATVAQGVLHGQVEGGVAVFKAIPFAQAPVGELRWRPPQPPKPWPSVREATAFGPVCTHMTKGGPSFGQPQSEDCLFLNVWTPAHHPAGAKLPVMVWIHGGSFTAGSGTTPLYDGARFARRGIVLITVEYRLGRLGFFAHPALSAEHPDEPQGNYGLMDNIAALKWVQANAAAFGGDPANVTVFGESAGGILVNDLMASPQARGLFAKAISQSGFGRTAGPPIRGEAPRTAEKTGAAWAATQGVSGSGPEAAKALRALSLQQLSIPVGGITDPNQPQPMIDGQVLPQSPADAFAAGREAPVPYIVGGNSFEASLFRDALANPALILARAGPLRDAVVTAYGGPSDLTAVAADFVTDLTVIEPDRALARLHVKNGHKAWVYYMSYLPAAERGAVRGVEHAGELEYVFGTLADHPVTRGGRAIPAATDQDRKISEAMNAYWAAFATRSDPGKAGGPAWPAYDLATDPVLEFGPDGVLARPQFRKAALDLAEKVAEAGGLR
jgi:para-nitrobenzyl esterase